MKFDPYAAGALHRVEHESLVADLAGYAHDAGVHPIRICTPLAGHCTPQEIDYIRKFNQHRAGGEVHGLCYVGSDVVEVEDHMAAMAGALVRNFVRAKLMTVGTLLDLLANQQDPACSCLLIPNFFMPKIEGGSIAAWQVSSLLDLLLTRKAAGQQTIIYVSTMDALKKEYGTAFERLIEAGFESVWL